MKQSTILAIDTLIKDSLTELAADKHIRIWFAKERDWVNYYAHQYLLKQCRVSGPLKYPAQIGIEVAVRQPENYQKPTVSRDLVIWPEIGMTCWNQDWEIFQHPLVIMEWKVHRPGRRNRDVLKERKWLRDYCNEHPSVVAYAVEVDGGKRGCPLTCTRFLGDQEDSNWLDLLCSK